MKLDWQKQVLAASGYLELGMFEDAARTLDELSPEDKGREEGARRAAPALHDHWQMGHGRSRGQDLVEIEPARPEWWINLAYSSRRSQSVEQAEAILLRARDVHPTNAVIAFNLACYANVTGRVDEAKSRLKHAIAIDKEIRELALNDEDLRDLRDWIASLE